MEELYQLAQGEQAQGLECYLASVSEDPAAIAKRLGLTIESWEEDGLGLAAGFAVRLASGTEVLVLQYEHAAKHLAATGSCIMIGQSPADQADEERSIAEILEALRIPPAFVTHRGG